MNKNEQLVQTIRERIEALRAEQAEFNKTTDDKIAALEITFETFTGEKFPKTVSATKTEKPARAPERTSGRGGRRGMKIDRQGIEKTLAFLQERGEKPTTVSMVVRKFNITNGAATQRLIKMNKLGWAKRIATGAYVAIEAAKHNGAGGAARTATAGEAQ